MPKDCCATSRIEHLPAQIGDLFTCACGIEHIFDGERWQWLHAVGARKAAKWRTRRLVDTLEQQQPTLFTTG